jgi:hypothetical protein
MMPAALALIRPTPEQHSTCVAAVAVRINILRAAARDAASTPSPSNLKKEFKTIADDLERAKATLTRCSAGARAATFWKDPDQQKAFLAALDTAIDAAQFHHDALVIPPGGPAFDNVKAAAVTCAAELLRLYSAESLLPTGRICRELAELLYKEATGKAVKLTQYCREIGRIEPQHLFKIPPAKQV